MKQFFLRNVFLFFSLIGYITLNAQGTQVDFSIIPKSGTILIYAHMDDDLIWMLPFWKITEKFIGGAMPATPSYETIVGEQQDFLDNNSYNIGYESNWFTPWDPITDREYTEYYWGIIHPIHILFWIIWRPGYIIILMRCPDLRSTK